jgi:uncharacterized protein
MAFPEQEIGLKQRVTLILAALGCGLWVFVVLGHYYPWFPPTADAIARICTIAAFSAAAVAARRSDRWRVYWRIPCAYAIGMAAISLDWYLAPERGLMAWLNVAPNTPAGDTLDKLVSSSLLAGAVAALTMISGDDLGSLGLGRPSSWWGWAVGTGLFGAAAAGSIWMATTLFDGHDLTWARVWRWSPLILVFVLSNGLSEELLFRGLFLPRLTPHVGPGWANLVAAIPFCVAHAPVTYTSDALFFLGVLFPLALAWGALTQRTKSIWPSVLFHAGMDIPIVLGLFSNLG